MRSAVIKSLFKSWHEARRIQSQARDIETEAYARLNLTTRVNCLPGALTVWTFLLLMREELSPFVI